MVRLQTLLIQHTGESWGWTDVADLNFDNMDMQNEMIEAMEYWVKGT